VAEETDLDIDVYVPVLPFGRMLTSRYGAGGLM
jgi:hypothetical protein